MPKKKNPRNAGRKKTRDWTPAKIGPFDVHPNEKETWNEICDAYDLSQIATFRMLMEDEAAQLGILKDLTEKSPDTW